jgi:hypothetical protein
MSSKRSERDFHIGGYAPRKQRDDGSAGDTGIQLAKSTSSKDQVFTNCGKADDQETAETGIAQAADRRRAAACVGPLGHRLALETIALFRRERRFAGNHIRGLFGHHQHRRIEVRRDEIRHRRGVDHTEALDALDPHPGIDHRLRTGAIEIDRVDCSICLSIVIQERSHNGERSTMPRARQQ